MKNIINIYTGVLIKQHLIYILVFISSLALLFFLLPGRWQEYIDTKEKIASLTTEVNRLGEQKNILQQYSPEELGILFNAANIAVPNSYNYFSLYRTLSDFEQKTGLKIDSLSIPASAFTPDGAAITIEALGNSNSIGNFLQNYSTQTGHAAMISNISVKPPTQSIHFDIIFYTHTPPKDAKKIRRINDSMLAILRNIDTSSTASSESIPTYPVKNNPF